MKNKKDLEETELHGSHCNFTNYCGAVGGKAVISVHTLCRCQKVFDTINREILWKPFRHYDVPIKIAIAKKLYSVMFYCSGCTEWQTKHRSPQETHTLCVFDQLPVVSWRRAKYKQMYGLKSTLTVSR